jgi:hypothetical protein
VHGEHLDEEALVASATKAVPASIDGVTAPRLGEILGTELPEVRAEIAVGQLAGLVALVGCDVLPERSRRSCLTLTDRAVAAIDEIGAAEMFGD